MSYVSRTCRLLLFVAILTETRSIKVTVKQGTIIGTTEATVFARKLYYAFYAVPYARAPVGKLRFKDPMPPMKFETPYDATTEFRGTCAQAHIVHKHGIYGNENCLHLNVYTPRLLEDQSMELKPVVVWIHGYAFTSSFSHIYSADFFIDHDILFVSASYRLGVFGFLKINETDTHANMGLKDIAMALKWVNKNIKKFGGDKKKVTVMSTDSAATFVSLLLTTKHRKLFSKLILQSGSMFSPSIFQADHTTELIRLEKELKKYSNLKLPIAPSKEIIKAALKIYSSKEVINVQKSLVQFSPIIERPSNKSLLTKKPKDLISTVQSLQLPILIGFNSQESISEVIPFLHNPRYLNSLSSFFKFMVPFAEGCKYDYSSETYKEISENIKRHYFKQGISEKSVDDFLKYVSDIRKYPVYKFIKEYVKGTGNKMYVYKFNYVGKFNAVKLTSVAGAPVRVQGAAAGDELCYLLKCEPLWETYVQAVNDTNSKDRKFILEISRYWSNFVKTGDPNRPEQPHTKTVAWRPMTDTEHHIMLFGKENKLIDSKIEDKMFSFWNGIYDKYYSSEHCNSEINHDERTVKDEL